MAVSSLESSVLLSRRSEPSQREAVDLNPPGLVALEHRIAQTVGYMRTCLNRPLQVTNLARMANVSPSHFFAVFKKQTGFAPIDFFIRLRMQRACELLTATKMSIKEIAAALGYDDPFYFSRLFKSVHEMAPSAYRLRGMTSPSPITCVFPLGGSQSGPGMSMAAQPSAVKPFYPRDVTNHRLMAVSQ